MARWTIIRVYEVPADNRIQATDRMLEALALGVEKDYHCKECPIGQQSTSASGAHPRER